MAPPRHADEGGPSRQADEPNRVDKEEECFESIDKLIFHGINVGDVEKLKDAGIYTCNGLKMHNKKSLTGIKGLSEAKVYKICEAAEKLLMNVSIPKNTAVICLDGDGDEDDNKKIMQSYIIAVKRLDDWLRDGEKVVDVSCFFGPGHDIVRTREGIFKMIFEVEGSFLIVPIEGTNLYLRGFSNEHGDFEFDFQDPNIVQDNSCTLLDLGVNYHRILDGSLENTMTGLWPLKEAVLKLCRYRGGSAAAIASAVGTVAIHISEAERAGPVHNFICRSLLNKSLSRLGERLVIWIRKHSKLSRQLLLNIDRMCKGEEPLPLNDYGLNITLHDLVAGLRVCYRRSYTEGLFKIESTESKEVTAASKGGTKGKRGGQGLFPIQKRSLTISSSECSYTVNCDRTSMIQKKSIQIVDPSSSVQLNPAIEQAQTLPTSSYSVRCSLSDKAQRLNCDRTSMIQKKSIQIVDPSSSVQLNPAIEQAQTLPTSSYSVRCSLNDKAQRETFHRTKPAYSLMEWLSGHKGFIRSSPSSYIVNCASARSQIIQKEATQVVDSPSTVQSNPATEKDHTGHTLSYSVRGALAQKETFHRTEPAYGLNCSPMERLCGHKGSIRSSSEENHSCMFQITTQRAVFGSTAIHPDGWANNRSTALRMRSSSNLLPNFSTSFPYQNVRRYLCRVLRFCR